MGTHRVMEIRIGTHLVNQGMQYTVPYRSTDLVLIVGIVEAVLEPGFQLWIVNAARHLGK